MIHHDKMRSYDRIAQELLRGQPKPERTAKFIDGKLVTGTKSLHRTKQSRILRLFWRLKEKREVVYYYDFGTFALKASTPAKLEEIKQQLFEVMRKHHDKMVS